MTLIAVPEGLHFADAAWTLLFPFQNNRSQWTGARRGAQLPGAAHWSVSAKIVTVMGHTQAAPIRAFLAKLKGAQNSFRIPAAKDQHGLSVSPQAKAGAIAGATSFTVKNLPPNVLHIPAGYYMTVMRPSGKSQMLMLVEPLIANSAGEALATFEPALIEAPAANSAVETRSPWCEVLLSDSKIGWSQTPGVRHDWNSIDAEEIV